MPTAIPHKRIAIPLAVLGSFLVLALLPSPRSEEASWTTPHGYVLEVADAFGLNTEAANGATQSQHRAAVPACKVCEYANWLWRAYLCRFTPLC